MNFHLRPLPRLCDHPLQRNNLEKHFGQIPVVESGQNCQKTHKHAKTFHMSLFLGLYNHPLQRNRLETLMFWKKPLFLDILAKFGHFRCLSLAKTAKRHIYRPRPFIWAYSQVSTTIRYKDTAWKRIDDRRMDRRTDGHPKSIGPQPLGWGPKKGRIQTNKGIRLLISFSWSFKNG